MYPYEFYWFEAYYETIMFLAQKLFRNNAEIFDDIFFKIIAALLMQVPIYWDRFVITVNCSSSFILFDL